jgi:hypothetical protein
MERWLARLAMSFFIIAALLLWEAYKGNQHGLVGWRITLDLIAAAAAISMGVAGIRAKHRRG